MLLPGLKKKKKNTNKKKPSSNEEYYKKYPVMNFKMTVPRLFKRLTKYSDTHCVAIIHKAAAMPSLTSQQTLQQEPSPSSTKAPGSPGRSPLTGS